MPNTSATGGYLTPVVGSDVPLYDNELQDFLHGLVVGVTGMDGEVVRPRWQQEPPNLPEATVNWVAIGEVDFEQDTYAAFVQGEEVTTLRRHEVVQVVASFYGPNSGGFAGLFCDGLQVAQNREVMVANGYGFANTGVIAQAPALINQVWWRKYDVPFWIKRQLLRQYAVLPLLEAVLDVQTEGPGSNVPFVVHVTFDLTSITWDAT